MARRAVTVVWCALPSGSGRKAGQVRGLILDTEAGPLEVCEQVFRDTNLYQGPIWDALQPLPEERTHTALSVGDRVVVDGVAYRCAPAGFVEEGPGGFAER